jgi:SagB-type dehydrogenase family enzyme
MKNKIEINKLLGKPASLSEKFHEKTKIKKFGLAPEASATWPKEWKTVFFKGYSRLKEIRLPKPSLPKLPLQKVLTLRRSSRDFKIRKISLNKLSSLLYFSAGLKDLSFNPDTKRFYPSAGARYPLEVYLINLQTPLPRGLYHYYLKNNSLEELFKFKKFDYKEYFNQQWLGRSSFIVIITSVFRRNTIKYGNRGYRHILIEAGHLGQNFYLGAASLNLYCCAIGGFVDDKLNKFLDIDGVEESVVYVLVFA